MCSFEEAVPIAYSLLWRSCTYWIYLDLEVDLF